MKSNLQAFYKDTNPKNPVLLPTDEMKIWTSVFKLIEPSYRRRSNEKDIPYIMRIVSCDRGRVFMAYLTQKKYFDLLMKDRDTSLVSLAGFLSLGSFPGHEGMQLKPSMGP